MSKSPVPPATPPDRPAGSPGVPPDEPISSPDDLGQEGEQSNIKPNTTDHGRRLDRE